MQKKLFFLVMFFLGTSLFGVEYKVYSWGYGDILGETLQSIAYLFHYNGYKDGWKIMLELGLFVSAMASIVPGSDLWRLPKLFLVSTLVWTAFVTTTVSIKIEDLKSPSYNSVINNVPWAVGYPMSLISTLEKELGGAYESATSIPTNLQYSNSGIAMPLNVSNASRSFKITDPTLSTNVRNYVYECAAPDFWNGVKSFDVLNTSTDIWSYMGGTNPAILVEYKNMSGTISVVSCTEAYNSISSDMNTYFSTTGIAMQQLAAMNGFTSSATLASRLGESEQWLRGASLSAANIVRQDASVYSVNEAFINYAAMNGQNSKDISQYIGKAESTASSNMLISGVLGSKYIPATKGILMSIVAGLTPLLAFAMLTPMAMKAFIGYLSMLLWLATWHFGEIILNHLVLIKAKGTISMYATNLGGNTDLTILSIPAVTSATQDYINMISSMYWMVPTISGLVIGGFSWMALSGMTGGITGRAAKGESVAGEMGSGNWMAGNTRQNTMMANKNDTTSMYATGVAHKNDMMGYSGTNLGEQSGYKQSFDASSARLIGSTIDSSHITRSGTSSSVDNTNVNSGSQQVTTAGFQGKSEAFNNLIGQNHSMGTSWMTSPDAKVYSAPDGSKQITGGQLLQKLDDGTVNKLDGNMTISPDGNITGQGLKFMSTTPKGDNNLSATFDSTKDGITNFTTNTNKGTIKSENKTNSEALGNIANSVLSSMGVSASANANFAQTNQDSTRTIGNDGNQTLTNYALTQSINEGQLSLNGKTMNMDNNSKLKGNSELDISYIGNDGQMLNGKVITQDGNLVSQSMTNQNNTKVDTVFGNDGTSSSKIDAVNGTSVSATKDAKGNEKIIGFKDDRLGIDETQNRSFEADKSNSFADKKSNSVRYTNEKGESFDINGQTIDKWSKANKSSNITQVASEGSAGVHTPNGFPIDIGAGVKGSITNGDIKEVTTGKDKSLSVSYKDGTSTKFAADSQAAKELTTMFTAASKESSSIALSDKTKGIDAANQLMKDKNLTALGATEYISKNPEEFKKYLSSSYKKEDLKNDISNQNEVKTAVHGDGTKFKDSKDIKHLGSNLDKESKGLQQMRQGLEQSQKHDNNGLSQPSTVKSDQPALLENNGLKPAPGINQEEWMKAMQKIEKPHANNEDISKIFGGSQNLTAYNQVANEVSSESGRATYNPLEKQTNDPMQKNKINSMTIDNLLGSKNV